MNDKKAKAIRRAVKDQVKPLTLRDNMYEVQLGTNKDGSKYLISARLKPGCPRFIYKKVKQRVQTIESNHKR